MEPILDEFEQALRRVELRPPGIDLLSNVTGDIMTEAEAQEPARWRRHIREPVRFAASMARLAALGVRCFIEVGPHPTLAGLGSETVTAKDVLWLPSVRRGKPAWPQLADSVARLYKAGYDIEWSGWCRDYQGRPAVAPTYPFQRERYWFTDIVGTASSPAKRLPGSLSGHPAKHPLLGAMLKSPALNGWVFQRELELRQPDYLHQHRVFGHAVAPGALFVEMMVAALREGPAWDSSRITNLAFEKPLVIPEDAAVTVQIIVGAETNGQVLLRIVSAAPADGPDAWVTHASGMGQRLDSARPATTRSLDALRAAATREVNVGDIYARVEKRGMEYGPAFRPMVDCRTGDGMSVGEAQLPAAVAQQAAGYGVHPCLLDAGLTLLASLSHDGGDEDATATWLPMGMDDIRFLQPLSPNCSVYGEVRADSNADTTVADLVFFDDGGMPCMEVIGYRARRADVSALQLALGGAAGVSPVYRIEWQSVDAPGASGDLAGTWLLLEDRTATGASVAVALAEQGARCIRIRQGAAWSQDGDRLTVPPGDDQVWQRVLDAAGITSGQEVRGIVHLWALDAKIAANQAGESALARALDACMPLVTLLGRELSPAPPMLRIVTRGATGPDGASAASWDAGAALWGLYPVLRAEHPEIDSRIVDLDPCARQSAADWLLVSLFGESAEDRLAFRGGEVLAPRLVDDKTAEEADVRKIPAGEGYRIDIAKRGTLDALRYLPALRTVPGPGEAEVRVRVAGLNFRDVLNVLGMYPGDPGPPGVEFAGVICRVGPGVSHVRVGDEVVGIGTGAFGRYTTVRAAGLIRIPGRLSMEEAATIPLAFLTAEWGLAHLANLRRNERVLIHAAAGGVGQAAVQLSMALGAEVFATAGSDEKRNFLEAQGVRHVYSSRDPSFADEVMRATNGEGVDVVLNALTGDMLRRSLELLREGGRFIELGKAEILDPADVAARYAGIRYEAFDLGSVLVDTPEQFQAMFASVAGRFDSGELTALPVRSFDAEHVIDAFRYMAQARHIGKITVTSGPPSERRSAPIRPDAAYIVTGGTGALGRKVVEWLASQGAGAIVVNARSALPDEASTWIEGLRGEGARLQWVQGDVARPEDVARLIHEAADGEMPVAGVWHTAGTLDDVLLHEQKRERFNKVLAPKVLGAWNLHNATKTLELDHFVLFSSIASLLGGPGQSAYSAANAALTALAEHRARSGLPALSIEWGAWEGAGMAGRLGDRERRVIEESGMRFLKPESAFEVMDRLLSCHAPRRVVADIDWKQIRLVTRTPPPLLRTRLAGSAAAESTAQAGPAVAFHPSELEGLQAPEVEAKLTDYILATLSGVLGARSGQIKADTQISDFGFDSLMAMELRNRIETQVGVLVPVSKLLTSSTPAGLAVDLAALIGVTETAAAQNRPDGWIEGEI
jgi:NADPH:quinone reductase-like Zn-dependent oxidoreductase